MQKLFEHGTQTQRALLASTMEGHILPLSLQMYGCRVVQKVSVNYPFDLHVLTCLVGCRICSSGAADQLCPGARESGPTVCQGCERQSCEWVLGP